MNPTSGDLLSQMNLSGLLNGTYGMYLSNSAPDATNSSTSYSLTFGLTPGFNVDSGSALLSGVNMFVAGNLEKSGQGELIVNTNLNVGGNANIEAGLLTVNGVLAANQINVNPQGILGGSGTVIGNTVNNGTVAPGNSPGILTMVGNYTQLAGGTLAIQVGGMTNYDRLIVTGTANLAGKLVISSWGGFKFAYGQQFPEFLSAAAFNGKFDQIVAPAGFRGRLLVVGDPTLTLIIAPEVYELAAKTQNQINVAKALDKYIPAIGGDKMEVSIALDELTASEFPAAFDAISPAFYQTVSSVGISLATAEGQLVNQRMTAVRLGAQGFSAQGFGNNMFSNNGQSAGRVDPNDKKSLIVVPENTHWSTWAQGNGVFGNMYSVQDLPSYHYASGGFLAGGDYHWSKQFATGVFTGYQGAYSSYVNDGQVWMNGVNFGTYATFVPGNGFYANGILMGGYSNYYVSRPIQFGTLDRTASSNPNSGNFASFIETGYDLKAAGFTFGPVVNAQYTYFGIAPFTEQNAGALNLAVAQENTNSLQTNIGGHIAYTWKAKDKDVVIIPEARMFWNHEFLQNPTSINATLNGGSGPSFSYTTVAPSRDSVFAGIGLIAQLGKRWNFSAYYNVDFGSATSITNIVSLNVGYAF